LSLFFWCMLIQHYTQLTVWYIFIVKMYIRVWRLGKIEINGIVSLSNFKRITFSFSKYFMHADELCQYRDLVYL
jgi:hypothetical protein